MSAVTRLASRRRVLKGLLSGTAVSVGLPLLDAFLNTNGTAFAATGAPLPVRFGTWLWGMGLCPGRWEPKTVGKNYEMTDLLKSLRPFKERISIVSGLNVTVDAGKLVRAHLSGWRACSSGEVMDDLPSVDTLISDAIGGQTRFRSLEVAASGANNPLAGSNTLSRRSAAVINPAEVSPLALYKRIFGPDFHDPSAGDFKPDPRMMVRRSVLSAIKESRETLAKELGSADRARLDEYFTSLRQLEQQVALQLEKPAPLAACTMPEMPTEEAGTTTDVALMAKNHRLLVDLLAHALACDQTRVVNVWSVFGELQRPGDKSSHHILTHEEPVDEKLGYQAKVAWYEERNMENFAAMLQALDAIKEGDGTLLDHSLIFALSDHGYAKRHTLENLPLFIAGRAGGRLKAGTHVVAAHDPVTRVGLTVQQVMGLPVSAWGTGSMVTDKALSELVA